MGTINEINVDNMKMLQNFVLLEAEKLENDEISICNGTVKIHIDASFQKEKHSIVRAKVKKIPIKLHPDSPTTIEIKEDDEVVFHYLAAGNALKSGRVINKGSKIYFMVDYHSMFCAIRGEEIIPLNNHVLVEPITEDRPEKIGVVFIPKSHRRRDKVSYGRIKYINPNSFQGTTPLKVGDIVYFKDYSDIPLEYSMHKSVSSEPLYRVEVQDLELLVNDYTVIDD